MGTRAKTFSLKAPQNLALAGFCFLSLRLTNQDL